MTTAASTAMTAAEIAAAVGGTLTGTHETIVEGIAPLDRATVRDLSFLATAKYAPLFERSLAGVVLVTAELAVSPGKCTARVVVKSPHDALLSLIPRFYRAPVREAGIHPTAVIAAGARIGTGATIEPYAVIHEGAEIGDRAWIGSHCVIGTGVNVGCDVRLHPHVVLYPGTALGERVTAHSGARIGSDGFGYVFRAGIHEKIPHAGRCLIGNDVEIGANTTIDRGSVDDTVVGDGTKIDNLVHLGHNVRVGRLCLLMAQVGVAGSSRIEDGAILAGQVGIAGHLTVGAGARLAAQAGVISDIPAGETWSGYPARPHRESLRASAALFKLATMLKRLEALLEREDEVSERRTIRERVELSGVGLHLGRECKLAFLPAAPGSGVMFRRMDLDGTPKTPAHVDRAMLSERRTQLGEGEGGLHTVEHVLAAVVGAGVDDVTIEMDSAEPPILDGSARPFFDALRASGIVGHGGEAAELRLNGCVRVVDGDSVYIAHPSATLDIEVSIAFPHPLVGEQKGRWIVNEETFAAELAGARTFGFVSEVETLRSKGLIQGASAENTLALDETGVVGNTLRWPNEFVRHKALDLVGDLALAGRRVKARISAVRPSHRGTVTFVRELLAQSHREGSVIGIEEIMRVLPHRYPFLLVDRILEFEEKKRIVGIKNVTINEPFFQGHFPGHPVMPGVLIIEAMAQVGGVLLMGAIDDPERRVVYIMSLDNVKFRKPVRPGDQLKMEVQMVQIRGPVCRVRGVAKVDGEVVCEAEMAAMVRDK